MNHFLRTGGAARPGPWLGLASVLLLGLAAGLQPARAADRPAARPAAAPAPAPASALFYLDDVSIKKPPSLERLLGDRRRMIQFATIGMCLALYIIIWRK